MADITSNLVAHWKLDETSGTTAADSSGSGYDGTYINSPTLGATGAFGTSKAVTFASASSQKVTATNGISGYPFTVAFWANPVDLAAQRDIVTLQTTLGIYRHEVRTTGTARLIRYDGTTNDFSITKASAFSAGTWTHVCAVHTSATSCSLYVNGALATTGTTSVAYTSPTTVTIAWGVTSQYFNGTIDDVRIYSRDLSSDDASALYAYTGSVGPLVGPGRLTNFGGRLIRN